MPVYLDTLATLRAIDHDATRIAKDTPAEGLPMNLIVVLWGLYQTDRPYASNLARNLGFQATSFTPLLDRLEKRGLIRREADTKDRRMVRICLTEKARERAFEVAISNIIAMIDKRFKGRQL